jgi:DNA-binding transcriptional regulator YiaG
MKIIKNYAGLEYVFVTVEKNSIAIEAALEIDYKIAKEVVKHKPLRGKEILFLRKQLKLSCAKLSLLLNGAFDASTISKWEKKQDDRLSPSNEMYMRVFFSEQLKVKVKATNSDLIPTGDDSKLEYAA